MANNGTSSITFPGGRLMTGQYSEQIESNILRTQMESGLQKQAKKSGQARVTRDVVYLMSTTQYETFKTWFRTSAADGALFFNWDDPVSGNTIDARIVNGLYDTSPVNARFNFFYITLQIESYS